MGSLITLLEKPNLVVEIARKHFPESLIRKIVNEIAESETEMARNVSPFTVSLVYRKFGNERTLNVLNVIGYRYHDGVEIGNFLSEKGHNVTTYGLFDHGSLSSAKPLPKGSEFVSGIIEEINTYFKLEMLDPLKHRTIKHLHKLRK